jgi:recombination protein RecA
MASKSADKEKKDVGENSSLNTLIQQITKQFGDGAIMRLGAEGDMPKETDVASTGAMTLDLALGVGGVPRGRVVEVYGPESSGKTTLVSHIVASIQKKGGQAAFIDTEHALDPGYMAKIGVDLKNLLVSQPDSGEDALNICETLVKSGAVDVVVLDSVAALAPKAELEGEMGQSHVGLQARLMSQALRKLTALINKTKCTCIFTNQIREKVGIMFGNPETTPGGRALKFYASIRLEVRRTNTIKDSSGAAIGCRTKVKVVKNKVAPPFTEGEFDILFNQGISWTGSIVDAATDLGLIEKRGSWLSYDGQQIGQGRDASVEALKSDLPMQEKLVAAIKAKHAEKVAARK